MNKSKTSAESSCGTSYSPVAYPTTLHCSKGGLDLGGAPSSMASAREHLEFLQAFGKQLRQQKEDAEGDEEVLSKSRCSPCGRQCRLRLVLYKYSLYVKVPGVKQLLDYFKCRLSMRVCRCVDRTEGCTAEYLP